LEIQTLRFFTMATSVDVLLTSEMRSFLQTLDRGILLRIPSRSSVVHVLISSVVSGRAAENQYQVVHFSPELLLNAVQNLDPDIVLECLSKAEIVATYLNREIEVVDASDGNRENSYFSG
jgi:hypothetical protein